MIYISAIYNRHNYPAKSQDNEITAPPESKIGGYKSQA